MFQIKRLNHAVLYVRDAARAARFYQDVLGFPVKDHMGADPVAQIGCCYLGSSASNP